SLKMEKDGPIGAVFASGPDSPLTPRVGGPGPGGLSRFLEGALDPATGTWTWFTPWYEVDGGLCERFPLFTDAGPLLLSSCGSVGGYLTPGSREVSLVAEDVSAVPGSGHGHRGTAIWAEMTAGVTRVRAWEPGGA